MTPIHKVIIKKDTTINPIWIMRQAGRYLPEFREIRKKNPNFIELCLNTELSSKITLQPLKRFDLDAAIIFSDILMLPYGLNQKVDFKKNFGPILGDLNLEEASKLDEIDFVKKIYPVYKAINKVNNHELTFPSMSQEEVDTILDDVEESFGSMGRDFAHDYIIQQQISY